LPSSLSLEEQAMIHSFYVNHLPMVYTFLRFNVHDEPTAEDLTSRTFMKALEYKGAQELLHIIRTGSPKAWILKVARNTLYDNYRRKDRRVQHLEDVISSSSEGDELTWGDVLPDENADLEGDLDLQDLNEAIERLAPAQKELLGLIRIGFTIREIAIDTGRRPEAVAMAYSRVLKALRTKVEIPK
jgi:RNA polymerase sigma-70 factor (ECF subfamily)